ncbi:hypothetical protein HQ865_24700 [Mucilaginibacter mali]|uniref:Uncharacterized protein n=1 Tax=Mucilaginibacter mali TaxID=2740462 RepID=A0A7D4UDT5_9SPHI|nr:hypothetical protein [Mucilaginibacter mali]QKJ32818.1 hypothetical protein HQ865_24700 [Mucilaginibacter mali]
MKKALTLILVFLAAAGYAQTTIIAQGSPFELKTDKPQVIPVTLRMDKPTELHFDTVSVFSARNGNVSAEAYRKGIAISWDQRQSLLKLTVDPALLDAQGTYDVNLRYHIGSSTDNLYLNLSLVRSPAVLTVDKINITEQGTDRKADSLIITETSGKAGAGSLKLSFCYVPGVPKGRLITLPQQPIDVLPGGQTTVAYHIDEDLFKTLPIGETVGKLQLTSNSIAAPIPVQVDIWNKRSRWWIVLTVFTGLLIGTLVRHVLKDKKDREQARLNGLQLVRDIKDYTGTIEDPKFQAAMNAIVQDVLTAIAPSNNAVLLAGVSAITDKIDAARKKYNSQKDTFESILNTSKTNYNSLKAELFDDSLLPQVSRILAASQQSLNKAGEKLDAFNPTEAEVWLSKAKDQEKAGLLSYIAYINSLISFMNSPANYLPALPAGNDTAAVIQSFTQAAQSTYSASFSMGVQDAKSALLAANSIQQDLNAALDKLETGVLNFYNSGNALAANHPDFIAAITKWFDALKNMVNNTDAKLQPVAYWNPALLTALNAVWPNVVAVSQITLGDGESQAAFAFAARFFSGSGIPAPGTPLADLDLADLDDSYRSVYGQYLQSNIIQLLALTLLIGLGGFLTYGKNFVGYPEEFITIFLLSFSLDITADSIAQLRNRPA